MHESIKKYNTLFFLVFFWMMAANLYGQDYQNTIKGIVYDVDNGMPLPAVNVYLSKTTKGDATDTLGVYEISNIPPGSYDLVFQFTGYEEEIIKIEIGTRDTLSYEAGLKYTSHELGSITVEAERDRRWQRYKDRFIRNFIGMSNNAGKTELLNPGILDFNMEGWGEYSATAKDELHIVNKALGYEYFVNLRYFHWNHHNDTGQTLYDVRMNELEPDYTAQEIEWEKKRNVTFDNSIRKFFLGLLDEEEGNGLAEFNYQGTEYKIHNGAIKKVVDEPKIDRHRPPNDEYEVTGFRLDIRYQENPLTIYSTNSGSSYLEYYERKNVSKQIFVLDSNGVLLNPLDVAIGGYWGKFRIADLLPINYRPDDE